MYTFAFEKLEVWQLSRQFVTKIYKITASFPEEEKFGLVSQIRRASVLISSNLEEGNSCFSKNDKARFFMISYSSLMEVINQLIISFDLGFIYEKQLNELRVDSSELSNKINALYKSAKNK